VVGLPLDYFPDASVQHNDWQVAPVTRLTLAAGVAGSGALFSFRNGSYDDPVYTGLTYDFFYIGGGGGLEAKGGLQGGLKGGQSSLFSKKWHPINCHQAFSAMDLNGSFGWILSFTTLVYDWVYMSAYNTSGGLFTRQWVSGIGLGVGADVTAGVWVYAF
jgi:hypothetical protein